MGRGGGDRVGTGAVRDALPRALERRGPLPALRRGRLLTLAYDDAPRRAPLGGGGRRDLPRRRPLGSPLLRGRDQPGERGLRSADDRRLALEGGIRLEPRGPGDARARGEG